MILGTIKKDVKGFYQRGEKRWSLVILDNEELPRSKSLAITFWWIFELIEILRVTFKANGKPQIQVESFSE